MRYSIRLSYNGAAYNGWQIQTAGETIQGSLQRALSILAGRHISVTGAGRTDAGVNAVNYVAHFDMDEGPGLEPGVLRYKLNAILGKGITVHEVAPAADDFHARFSACSREYKYLLHRKKDPFMDAFSWYCGYSLDVGAMNEAALFLEGTHDFRCFEKKGGNNRTSVCTVSGAVWRTYTPAHVMELGYPASPGDYLVFTIRADRFLRNMVRAIVGSLIDVGRGKESPGWIKSLVESGTRSDAGESVPGHALFLTGVEYEASSAGKDCQSVDTGILWHRD